MLYRVVITFLPRRMLCTVLLLVTVTGCGGGGAGSGVISLAPNVTETIYAVGKGSQLIGVSDYDDYPSRVQRLPQLGGYIDPDLEQIALLRPALIFVPGRHEKVTAFGEQHGITVMNIHMDSLATIDFGIATVGRTLDAVDEATALRSKITAELEAIREAVAPFERPKVLIVLGRERGSLRNLQTVGGTSFISELVEIAGGDNIYGDEDKAYIEASKETILVQAPDVIIEIHAGRSYTKKQTEALFSDWLYLDGVPAWKSGRIYLFTDSHMLRPGPRITDVARQIARKLHFSADLSG